MQPGERLVTVEAIKGPVARHVGVPPETPFPGTQTHPDDRDA